MLRSKVVRLGLAIAVGASVTACAQDPAVVSAERTASGDKYFTEGKYPEAIVEYRAAIQAVATSGRSRYKLAEAYARNDDVGPAAGEYIRAADLLPDDADAQLKAAAVLIVAGRSEEAKTRADTVLARDPKHVHAMIVRGNAMAGLKDLEGAVAQIEQALALDPGQSSAYTNLGALELARGKTAEAEEAFTQAVTVNPKSVDARLALANYYFAVGKREAAEAALKEALTLDPRNVLTNRTLATFSVAAGRAADAETYLKNIDAAEQTPDSRLMLADYYAAMRRYDEAAAIYQQLTSDEKLFANAKVRLAALEQAQGRRPEARKHLDEVLEKDKGNRVALLARGRLQLAENQRSDAIETLTAAVNSNPQDAESQYVLGQAYAAQGDLDAAADAFRSALSLNPRALSAELALGRAQLARRRTDEAIQHAQHVLAAQPANAEARVLLARGFLAKGKAADADRELKALVQRDRKSATVEVVTGSVRMAQNDIAGARAAFQRALALDKDNVEALGGMLNVAFREKRPDEARSRIKAALVDEDERPDLLLLAARTYQALDDAPATERALRRAIELDPKAIAAYTMLGQLYARQQKLDEARREFEEVVRHQPRSVPAHTVIGMIYDAQQRITEAEAAYKKALEADPKAAVAANNLAWIYAAADRDLDVALQLAQAAKSVLPDDPNVSDTLGWVYYKKSLYEPAVREFEHSVARNPQVAEIQFRLGMAYMRAGDEERARQHLREALRLKPEFAGAEEARKALTQLGA